MDLDFRNQAIILVNIDVIGDCGCFANDYRAKNEVIGFSVLLMTPYRFSFQSFPDDLDIRFEGLDVRALKEAL